MSIYYTDILEILRAAGCKVGENATTDGWQHRARSSGGFATAPLGVQWHHTASNTAPANDLAWMIDGSDDAPIGNLLLDRAGTYWPIAAGAANTAGKGGPVTMSRGIVKLDSANSTTWAIEAANNGVGEVWPRAQIDAYFTGSNALNAHFGNLPGDVFNHNTWAPDRKVDPATAVAVDGPWQPGSSSTSGTWTQVHVRDECARRWGGVVIPPTPVPEPTPPPDPDDEDNDMAFIVINNKTGQPALVYGDGRLTGLAGADLPAYEARFGAAIPTDDVVFSDMAAKG